MKTIMKLCALVLLSVTTVALAQEPVRLISSVQKVEAFVNEQGEQERRLVAAERVVPGDELRYTVTFANQGAETVDAGSIVITNPVPNNTIYLMDSAGGSGTDVVFSVDGGETWGTPDELVMTGEDGQSRVAEDEDYTHIRWTFRPALEPGQEGSVFFRVRLR
ncbi:MAG: DUF11 domain-containing protein [Gammaproteobacteria bacterium]|nr:DUF11 domain-containing protein [Gammaproteobacteria bacterium]